MRTIFEQIKTKPAIVTHPPINICIYTLKKTKKNVPNKKSLEKNSANARESFLPRNFFFLIFFFSRQHLAPLCWRNTWMVPYLVWIHWTDTGSARSYRNFGKGRISGSMFSVIQLNNFCQQILENLFHTEFPRIFLALGKHRT